MKVTITQPVKGANVGDTIDVNKTEGDWLTAYGYAIPASNDEAKAEPSTNDDASASKTRRSRRS